MAGISDCFSIGSTVACTTCFNQEIVGKWLDGATNTAATTAHQPQLFACLMIPNQPNQFRADVWQISRLYYAYQWSTYVAEMLSIAGEVQAFDHDTQMLILSEYTTICRPCLCVYAIISSLVTTSLIFPSIYLELTLWTTARCVSADECWPCLQLTRFFPFQNVRSLSRQSCMTST